jgi:hypothetical protein
MTKKEQDRIATRAIASIELRKHTELNKNPALRQELPDLLNDDQMMVLLTERVGHLAGTVCGADNLEQQQGALLKVTAFCKIWLENIEGRFKG